MQKIRQYSPKKHLIQNITKQKWIKWPLSHFDSNLKIDYYLYTIYFHFISRKEFESEQSVLNLVPSIY